MKPEISSPVLQTEIRSKRRFFSYFYAAIGFVNGAAIGVRFTEEKYGKRFSRRHLLVSVGAPALSGAIIGSVDGTVGIIHDAILQSVPPK